MDTRLTITLVLSAVFGMAIVAMVASGTSPETIYVSATGNQISGEQNAKVVPLTQAYAINPTPRETDLAVTMPAINAVRVPIKIKARSNPNYEMNLNMAGWGGFYKPDVTTSEANGDKGHKWVLHSVYDPSNKRTYFNLWNELKKQCMGDALVSRASGYANTLHGVDKCDINDAIELVSTATMYPSAVAMVYKHTGQCLTFQGNARVVALATCNGNDVNQMWEITADNPADKSSVQKMVDVASCAGGVFTAIPACAAVTAMTLGGGAIACAGASVAVPATCQAAFS